MEQTGSGKRLTRNYHQRKRGSEQRMRKRAMQIMNSAKEKAEREGETKSLHDLMARKQ